MVRCETCTHSCRSPVDCSFDCFVEACPFVFREKAGGAETSFPRGTHWGCRTVPGGGGFLRDRSPRSYPAAETTRPARGGARRCHALRGRCPPCHAVRPSGRDAIRLGVRLTGEDSLLLIGYNINRHWIFGFLYSSTLTTMGHEYEKQCFPARTTPFFNRLRTGGNRHLPSAERVLCSNSGFDDGFLRRD